jgi:PKD repeat protein
MKNLTYLLLFAFILAFAGACNEDDEELTGLPPTEADAAFTFVRSSESDNILNFTAEGDFFMMKWDLGNGSKGDGKQITGTYPTAGTYRVTLTVFNDGGSASSSQDIIIDETDPTLLDKPLYNLLTGGADAVNGKTWVVDSARAGHFGVGPDPSSGAGDIPEYYAAGPNEKSGGGMYDDRYTFYLADFEFDMETNGDVYINGVQTPSFPGAVDSGVGDFRAPYTPPADLTWSIAEPEGDYPVLSLTNGSFIGYYVGGNTYEIVSIEENELFLRTVDQGSDGLAWYLRLIPAGFEGDPGGGGGEEPTEDVLLPLTFETVEPGLEVFGGTGVAYIDNPDKSGINTSNRVLEVTHGGETWAGLFLDVTENLDLTNNPIISIKVSSPIATDFLLKLEEIGNADNFVEVTTPITVTNQWTELTFDLTGQPNVFGRVVLFPGFGTSDPNVFYIDDIQYGSEESNTLTLDVLTGGSSRAWTLKPAAGAFGVGPAKGSDAFFPNGTDISGDRPCLFNDQFIFKTGGEFEYDALDDIFGEGYMGLSDGCQAESNLTGTPAEPWGSGVHTFSFQEASGDSPATITVTGTGAFIVLPKAFNGGEYASAPPADNASVTYEVLNFNGNSEELTITIDISGDGSVYWNFTLIPVE